MNNWKEQILGSYQQHIDEQLAHEKKLADIDTYLGTLIQEFNDGNNMIKANLVKKEIGWDIHIHNKKLRLTERIIDEYEQKHPNVSLEHVLKIILVERFNWQEES